jgi:hypothetical protein
MNIIEHKNIKKKNDYQKLKYAKNIFYNDDDDNNNIYIKNNKNELDESRFKQL